jgi:hypothetical protein
VSSSATAAAKGGDGGDRDDGKEAQETVDSHVMLSYPWHVQAEVKCMRDALEKAGIKTWMDIHDMRGDTLDAMATAVDNASCVVIVMTTKYKSSYNCKLEATYAASKQVITSHTPFLSASPSLAPSPAHLISLPLTQPLSLSHLLFLYVSRACFAHVITHPLRFFAFNPSR